MTGTCPSAAYRLSLMPALNMNQVESYGPPPNPAKITDSRFAGYLQEHGTESWELDALEPSVIANLIRTEVDSMLDRDLWDEKAREQERARDTLVNLASRWAEVEEYMSGRRG